MKTRPALSKGLGFLLKKDTMNAGTTIYNGQITITVINGKIPDLSLNDLLILKNTIEKTVRDYERDNQANMAMKDTIKPYISETYNINPDELKKKG